MLHGLGRADQARIKGGGALVVLHDFGAFFKDAVDRRAGLALGLLVDDAEHFDQAFHLAFGLIAVLFEGGLQFRRSGQPWPFWARRPGFCARRSKCP